MLTSSFSLPPSMRALPLKFCLPPAILKEKEGKEWMKKRSRACLESRKESVFLNGQFVSFSYRTSSERERGTQLKKVSDSPFGSCWWCLCWLLVGYIFKEFLDWKFSRWRLKFWRQSVSDTQLWWWWCHS